MQLHGKIIKISRTLSMKLDSGELDIQGHAVTYTVNCAVMRSSGNGTPPQKAVIRTGSSAHFSPYAQVLGDCCYVLPA